MDSLLFLISFYLFQPLSHGIKMMSVSSARLWTPWRQELLPSRCSRWVCYIRRMGPSYKPVVRAKSTVILNVGHLQKLAVTIRVHICPGLLWPRPVVVLSLLCLQATALNSVAFFLSWELVWSHQSSCLWSLSSMWGMQVLMSGRANLRHPWIVWLLQNLALDLVKWVRPWRGKWRGALTFPCSRFPNNSAGSGTQEGDSNWKSLLWMSRTSEKQITMAPIPCPSRRLSCESQFLKEIMWIENLNLPCGRFLKTYHFNVWNERAICLTPVKFTPSLILMHSEVPCPKDKIHVWKSIS